VVADKNDDRLPVWKERIFKQTRRHRHNLRVVVRTLDLQLRRLTGLTAEDYLPTLIGVNRTSESVSVQYMGYYGEHLKESCPSSYRKIVRLQDQTSGMGVEGVEEGTAPALPATLGGEEAFGKVRGLQVQLLDSSSVDSDRSIQRLTCCDCCCHLSQVFDAFVNGFLSRSLIPHHRSQAVMAPKGTQRHLGYTRIVASQWESLVMDHDDDVLVMFVSEDEKGRPFNPLDSDSYNSENTDVRAGNIKDRFHYMAEQNKERGNNNVRFYLINQVSGLQVHPVYTVF
jgi:hypothetical protein